MRVAIPLVVVSLFLTLAAIACGGPASPGVATVPPTATPTVSPSSSSSTIGGVQASSATPVTSLTPNPVAFSACMRANGVANFPDPTGSAGSFHISIGPGTGVDPSSPVFQAAQQACQGLMGPLVRKQQGTQPTITSADQADYLKAIACMRTHGYPEFPDPVFSNGGVRITIPPNIDQSSTQFANAVLTCQKLIPAGLPYSGTN